MPIYTTYLGFLNKHGGADKIAMKLGSCFIYYVARNRGNNSVAPSAELLSEAKRGKIDWKTSEQRYLSEIRKRRCQLSISDGSLPALHWMESRAEEAKIGNILLVCFEKDAQHCHRRLLAQEIARRFGVEYKGELS